MFASVAFKFWVAQASAVADDAVTAFGDEDADVPDDEDADVPDVPDEEADEEEAVPDGGTEDEDDAADEHPAAATTAPTATAPPNLTISEAEPNTMSHPLLATQRAESSLSCTRNTLMTPSHQHRLG